MATQQHLQILNPEHDRELRSFSLFPLLPVELRLDIWKLSLRRPRLITVELAPNPEQSTDETRNSLGRVVSGTHYSVTANGSSLLSKLLRVSSEARAAALQFYRVHLPSHFKLCDKGGHGTLFLNPEFDTVHIKPGREIHNFVDLLHDLRAYDPLDVGLRNLAVDNNNVLNLLRVDLPSVKPHLRAAFTDTLANLRQVYFLCLENAGRIYLGPLNGIHTVQGYEFHRSRPIMSTIATFDRVGRDPRQGMGRDLSRVFVGTFEPRQMVYGWHLLLDAWQIRHPRGGPEYRLLVSNGWGSGATAKRAGRITDRESAAEWLCKEDERWARGQERHASMILRRGGKLPIESPEELERVPRPAIGFWLFPVEALGPMPGLEGGFDEYHNSSVWRAKRVVDMRQHWPELCLASMP
ncbi:hypothetical protein F5X98DRAFT_353385 [Xylaria grammica]|nr:hypothetical protein F5X98DRAFT_353385 [Xylaria grammica]